MYLNKKLHKILLKSENHSVQSLFTKYPSVVWDFIVSSFSYQLLSVLVLFDFLNLVPPSIPLSVGDTYYLYLSTLVAHTTIWHLAL